MCFMIGEKSKLRMYFQLCKKMHTTTYQTRCIERSDYFFSPLKIFIELSKHRKTNVTTKSLIQTNNIEPGGVNERNMLNKELTVLTVLAAKYCWALFLNTVKEGFE